MASQCVVNQKDGEQDVLCLSKRALRQNKITWDREMFQFLKTKRNFLILKWPLLCRGGQSHFILRVPDPKPGTYHLNMLLSPMVLGLSFFMGS